MAIGDNWAWKALAKKQEEQMGKQQAIANATNSKPPNTTLGGTVNLSQATPIGGAGGWGNIQSIYVQQGSNSIRGITVTDDLEVEDEEPKKVKKRIVPLSDVCLVKEDSCTREAAMKMSEALEMPVFMLKDLTDLSMASVEELERALEKAKEYRAKKATQQADE